MEQTEIEADNTPKVSKADVLKYVRGLELGGMMRNRIIGILRHFTVDEFVNASTIKWEAAYKQDHPESKYGLGKNACKVLAGVAAFVNNTRFEKRIEARGKEAEEKRMASPEVQAKIAEAKEAVENPVFTRKQIKALSDMMEFCELETVNLRTIAEFFKAFGVKNPFVESQEPGRPNAQQ